MQGPKNRSPIDDASNMEDCFVIIPVRCFSCGNVIGDRYEEFKERVGKKEDPKKVLDSLNLRRYCCRKMILTHVDYIDEIIKFDEKKDAGP